MGMRSRRHRTERRWLLVLIAVEQENFPCVGGPVRDQQLAYA